MEKSLIALVGNPNVGKSTLFNGLTGSHCHTGNWPGKTVGLNYGSYHGLTFVDLPGTYSLNPNSPEEEVARDFLLQEKPQGVIAVCDAGCLERNLILVLNLLKITNRVLLVLNYIRESRKKGITVDCGKLQEHLGIPVLEMEVCSSSDRRQLDPYLEGFPMRTEGLWDAEADSVSQAQEIAEDVVTRVRKPAAGRDAFIDRFLTGKISGFACMLLFLMGLLWITVVAANYPSQLLSRGLGHLLDSIQHILETVECPQWVTAILCDGCLKVLFWVVSVMLPPMAIFFPLFSLLEDSGYLPRIAYNLDRPFACCGACGKQALTMCMGLGCNAVGVTGCRIIDSPRERLLAMLTNSLMPCNGRFPAILALVTLFSGAMGASFGGAFLICLCLILCVTVTFAVTALLSNTVLKGKTVPFTLELPPYRRPRLVSVLVDSLLRRTLAILGRAMIVSAPAGILIWVLANCNFGKHSLLLLLCEILDPVGKILGMDGKILTAFLLGFPANELVLPILLMIYMQQGMPVSVDGVREVGSVLASFGMNQQKALCTLVFFLFHWPCATTMLTVYRESKSKCWTAAAFMIPTACGILLCSCLHLIFIILN